MLAPMTVFQNFVLDPGARAMSICHCETPVKSKSSVQILVAHGNAEEARSVEAELVPELARHGPIRSTCRSLELLENSDGNWRQLHVFHLA